MNENDINRIILRADDNLREAVRHREQRQPPLPAGLNERLMQRIEKEVPAKPENTRRQVWLWMAAASVAAIMIVLLMSPKENSDEAAHCSGEFAIRQNGIGDLKSPQAEKYHRIINPDTQDSRIANSSELKAIAKSKMENKPKRKVAPRQEPLLAVDQGDRSLDSVQNHGPVPLISPDTVPKRDQQTPPVQTKKRRIRKIQPTIHDYDKAYVLTAQAEQERIEAEQQIARCRQELIEAQMAAYGLIPVTQEDGTIIYMNEQIELTAYEE